MSITDELRAVAAKTECANGRCEKLYRGDLEHIADRIDAEHQKALDEWKAEHGQMWLKGYAECHAELLEGNETLASDLEGCGWMRLPKDADGEYIHVGDVMELVSYDEDYRPVIRPVDAVGEQVFFAWSKVTGRYAQYEACAYRHHHAPTVEDVLEEFGIDWEYESDCEDRAALLKEYASKLQLKED